MQGKLTGLSDVLASAGKNLEYRQTGRDPKTNGYAYAEVPDWKLRWWEETARIMESRLASYEAALGEAERLAALIAHDLQGRVDASKIAAVAQIGQIARKALEAK